MPRPVVFAPPRAHQQTTRVHVVVVVIVVIVIVVVVIVVVVIVDVDVVHHSQNSVQNGDCGKSQSQKKFRKLKKQIRI